MVLTALPRMWRAVRFLPLVLVTASTPLIGACSDSSGPCCKVCREGKACGDSCISRSDTCHVGSGCACDG